MKHDDIVSAVIARAAGLGILAHYCKDARFCSGDPGITDLIMVGAHKTAFVEVKTEYGRMESGQNLWMHALIASGQLHYVVRPADLENGKVDAILDQLAYGQDVLFRGAVA